MKYGFRMNRSTGKAIFVGAFASVFSGGLMFLMFQSVGVENAGELGEMIRFMPFVIGAAIGLYAGKFSLRASAAQAGR